MKRLRPSSSGRETLRFAAPEGVFRRTPQYALAKCRVHTFKIKVDLKSFLIWNVTKQISKTFFKGEKLNFLHLSKFFPFYFTMKNILYFSWFYTHLFRFIFLHTHSVHSKTFYLLSIETNLIKYKKIEFSCLLHLCF